MTMRSFLYCGIIVSFFASSYARGNTLVIVLRTEEASIIAADSKLAKTDGRDIGTACKIHITDQFAWATSGILNEPGGAFDIWATAETAIKAGGSFDEIVTRFDRELISQLKELPPRIKRINPRSYDEALKSGHAATIIFVKNTDVRLSDFMLPNKADPDSIEVVDQSCPGNLCIATNSIISMMGYYEAAQAEFVHNSKIWDQMGIVPALNYLMDIQHNTTPSMVAAPVSILRIDKGGNFQWLQKGVCN